MGKADPKDSAARRRILARKAALASIAGLTGAAGAGACTTHETQTVTVEPVAPAPSSAPSVATARATATVTHRRPPPPPDDDDMLVTHPMHGQDPVGPPHVIPTPPPWSTLLGKITVSSKAQLSGGKRVVEVTVVFTSPLRRNDQRVEQNVTGGTIVKPTFIKSGQGTESVIFTIVPNPGSDPVQIMLAVIDDQGQRWGHAVFEVPGARSGAVGQSVPGKTVRLDN